jgi:hypothetical protein
MESKNRFLLGRDLYSRQLREFLNAQQKQSRTCVVFYDTKRSKLEKKYLKMKRLYTQSKDGKKHFDVQFLGSEAFRFQPAKLSFEDEK